jgi:hypothetical protein
VWDVDRTWEAGWLAGILDGEGCLTFASRKEGGARLSIGQVAGITADRIDAALKERVGAVGRHTRPAGSYSSGRHAGLAQAQRRWQVDGRADILKLLGSVRPARLLVDSGEAWDGFALRGKARRGATVTAVEAAGTGMVASLSTSTETYIAGGFASHNTAQKEAVREQTTASELAIGKSETAIKEQLHQLTATFATANNAQSENLSDLKDRIGAIESERRTIARTDDKTSTNQWALAGMAVLVLAVLVNIALNWPK